jgi:hypothetical protein
LPPLPQAYLATPDRSTGRSLNDVELTERAAFRDKFSTQVLDPLAARHAGVATPPTHFQAS